MRNVLYMNKCRVDHSRSFRVAPFTLKKACPALHKQVRLLCFAETFKLLVSAGRPWWLWLFRVGLALSEAQPPSDPVSSLINPENFFFLPAVGQKNVSFAYSPPWAMVKPLEKPPVLAGVPAIRARYVGPRSWIWSPTSSK